MSFRLNKKTLLLAIAVGFCLTATAFLPIELSWVDLSDLMLRPGVYLASPLWPEGIESDPVFGVFGVLSFLSTVYIGSLLAWIVASYFVISLLRWRVAA